MTGAGTGPCRAAAAQRIPREEEGGNPSRLSHRPQPTIPVSAETHHALPYRAGGSRAPRSAAPPPAPPCPRHAGGGEAAGRTGPRYGGAGGTRPGAGGAEAGPGPGAGAGRARPRWVEPEPEPAPLARSSGNAGGTGCNTGLWATCSQQPMSVQASDFSGPRAAAGAPRAIPGKKTPTCFVSYLCRYLRRPSAQRLFPETERRYPDFPKHFADPVTCWCH